MFSKGDILSSPIHFLMTRYAALLIFHPLPALASFPYLYHIPFPVNITLDSTVNYAVKTSKYLFVDTSTC